MRTGRHEDVISGEIPHHSNLDFAELVRVGVAGLVERLEKRLVPGAQAGRGFMTGGGEKLQDRGCLGQVCI